MNYKILNYSNSDDSDKSDKSGPDHSGMLSTLLIFCCLTGGSLSFGYNPSYAFLHTPAHHQTASPTQSSLASPQKAENPGIEFNVAISYPSKEELTTPYRQIFLEGKIRAQNGIRRIKLNDQDLFNGVAFEELIQKNWPKLNRGSQGGKSNQSNQGLAIQNKHYQDPLKGKGMPKTKDQSKHQDLAEMRQTLNSYLEKYNLYYLNRICTLKEGDNRLIIVVEDNLGHRTTKSLNVRSIPQVEDTQVEGSHQGYTDAKGLDVQAIPQVDYSQGHTDDKGLDVRAILSKESSGSLKSIINPKGQNRMILALIPPAKKAGAPVTVTGPGAGPNADTTPRARTAPTSAPGSVDLSDYIYHRLSESFTRQERFQLVERSKLPWLLIEKAIQANDISQQEFTRQLGHLTPAEGVIFLDVQKRDNGLEIVARLVDMKSATLVLHRVFTPVIEPQGHQVFEELNTIISGLAMKFRDSFPLLAGAVLSREGPVIRVNLGSEKGISRGIWYNIMGTDGREIICRAVVEEVAKGTSKARIIEEEKIREIRPGYRVNIR